MFDKDFVWICELTFVDIPLKRSIAKVGPLYDQQSHQLMYPSISEAKFTVSQLLARLRHIHQPDHKILAGVLKMSYTTYLKTERGHRELSFLMALRICQFYKMDLHEFISMLSDEELERNELSIIKALEKRERKKAEALKAKVIDIQTEKPVPVARP